SIVFLLLCAIVASVATRPQAQTRTPDVVAIKGATIVTVTRGTIPNGTIVLRAGKIAAVGGANVSIPQGADVVDGAGTLVSPGIIDCHSHIAADSINEGGTTVSSMTGIEDVFDPADVDIYRDLAGGVTTANVLHGSANPIGGKNYVIKLRWGKARAQDFAFEGALPGIKFALGENPKRRGGGAGAPAANQPRYPATRMGVEYVIRDAFTRAKAYQREWQEFERRRKAGERVVAPRRAVTLEPLAEMLDGKRLVHAHSYRADEILMLLRVADEFGFKIATLQHVLEGYKVAKEIAAHGAGASTFADWWGYKIEAIDAIPYNAALLTRKGVVASVNSDDAELARHLTTEAAKSMKWGGLSEDEALALVTINPAKQLRVDNRVGSLEVGKDADVVIWNHHPLSSYAIVERVYIDGQKYYDRQDDQKRMTELAREKESLVNAEKGERRGPTATEPPPAPRGEDDRPPRAAGTAGQASTIRTITKGVLAITNAAIYPVSRPPIDRGTIVMRDGIIEAIGANVAVPPGARVIDAAGAGVYPGLINAQTTMGLEDPGAGNYSDANELLEFNPQLRAQVAFHNDSEAIPVARANGITTIGVTPGGRLLGGQIAVMDLDGYTWEESTVAASAGVSFQFPRLGGGGGRGGGGRGGPPPDRSYDDLKKERDAQLDRVARLLDDARAYAKAASPNRQRDLILESLVPVADKRQPLLTRVSNDRDIRDAIAFADRAGVRLVVAAPPAEAALAAPLLKEKNVPVILLQVLTLPSRVDLPHQASYAAAAELAKAGVKFAIAVPSDTNARQLPYHAAQAVGWGLSRDEALKAITINAAEILGVADKVGSLERGKIANLFVAKGDPLEVRTSITHVVIAGKDVPKDNKQFELYERYAKRP